MHLFRHALLVVVLPLAFAFPALADVSNAAYVVTFTNPAPADGDSFGYSIALISSNRVVVAAYRDDAGATNSGTVYIFDTTGNLLVTINNPYPAPNASFGQALAALHTDRVLVSASSGVHIFHHDGLLLASITNPATGGGFGTSVATLAPDKIIIGAPLASVGANQSGAAYIYDTNGSLLETLSIPHELGRLGSAVAALGTDRILVGARDYRADPVDPWVGRAYLFSTNGSLLATFTNSTPEDQDRFGHSVTALGHDRVMISAPSDKVGGTRAGTVHLFDTNGALLTTFTNPAPDSSDQFGWSIASVGNDQILVGAPTDDTAKADSGSAYLFDTNGVLLHAFAKSVANTNEYFGHAVASFGKRLFVSAWGDDYGAKDSGVVRMFEPPYPHLTISLVETQLHVEWLSREPGLLLQQTDSINSSPLWSIVTEPITTFGFTNIVQLPRPTSDRFFRLRRQ